MPYVMVDIESDGPIPGDYSMICFGAVIVEPELNRTFYGKLKPISDAFIPAALAVSGFSREECVEFDDPKHVMQQFQEWLAKNCMGRTMFVSDNNGFDWQFINWCDSAPTRSALSRSRKWVTRKTNDPPRCDLSPSLANSVRGQQSLREANSLRSPPGP